MIQDKSILCVIPARGGSKTLPGKNIRELAGKPLIAWSIDEARKSEYIDRIIVSTDDEIIADIAQRHGAEIPFLRPDELATDEATTIDVMIHAINYLPEKYEYVVLLQPTSPLRSVSDIDRLISLCLTSNARSATTVTKVGKPLDWIYTINEQKQLGSFMKSENSITRRQDSQSFYQLNGAVYVNEVNSLLKDKKFITGSTVASEMPDYKSIDIDTELDFIIAEQILDKIITYNSS